MWRRRPSKQRLWLGSGRYLCGRRREPNANADRDRHCDAHGNRNSIAYTTSDADTPVRANGKAASHSRAPPVRGMLTASMDLEVGR